MTGNVGRVVRVDAKVCHVEIGGKVILAAPAGLLFETRSERKNPIAVGDHVEVSSEGNPVRLEKVLERKNYLGRTASSHDPREQVLVANVDQLLIIGSLKSPGFSSNRTDRILAACTWHRIPVTLVLNKIDLFSEEDVAPIRKTYKDIPIPVLETSAKDGRGVEQFAALLKDQVSVLYGPSGAGKSSLLNAIQPGLNIREGKISKYWKQGKHTTSYSALHALDQGGWVIDTPGIRVFRLHGACREDLRDMYPDFAPFQSKCHFPDCTHDHEPDCAVAEAVEDRKLSPTRYGSYLEILDELDAKLAYDPDQEAELGELPPE
ncbi:MAG: ribosome biogenesis GTPase [Planctomycetota bacterium]|jgi:ribosome biogenesis GTPase